MLRPAEAMSQRWIDDQFRPDGWDQRPYVLAGATEVRRQNQAVGWLPGLIEAVLDAEQLLFV